MKTLIKELFSNLSQTFFVGTPKHGAILVLLLAPFLPLQVGAGIIGSLISLRMARALNPNRVLYDSGLFGMNGFFFGVGLTSLFSVNAYTALWLSLGALSTAFVTLFLHRLFQHWQFPILVLPYMLCLEIVWLIRNDSPTLSALPLTQAEFATSHLTQVFLTGLLNTFSEIFFQSNPMLGALLLAFLALTNRRLLLSGLVGGVFANLTALMMGLPLATVASGFYGFNGALAAIALGFGFLGVSWPKQILASIFSVPLMAALSRGMGSVGLLALGIPYLLTVWIFLSTAAKQIKPSIGKNDGFSFPWKNASQPLPNSTFFSPNENR